MGRTPWAGQSKTFKEENVERAEFETIIYEKEGPVARIVLNTPEKANVQTARQVWDFDEALARAAADDDIKVLIVKGNGKGFCAGHAIVKPEEMPEVYPTTRRAPEYTWKHHHYDLFLWPPLRLWEFPKITIAQVHGYCVGGGTVYGLLTDLTVASEDAYFQMPLPQGFGLPGAQTMIEPWVMMNRKRAAEYLFLAPTIDAEQALEWGMINRVVPLADLEQTTEEMADTVAKMPLTTIMATKAGLKRAWEMMGMRVHLQQSTDLVAFCSSATDVKALMAQMEGRRPRQEAATRADDARASQGASQGASQTASQGTSNVDGADTMGEPEKGGGPTE
ncbi:MAG TPA: enoyl-CoA hydratase-related protein [Acidimicrobiales bacterium]|nr:enoyl-CoA hydratase-related protein [Acidimicrobiales bacterium]